MASSSTVNRLFCWLLRGGAMYNAHRWKHSFALNGSSERVCHERGHN